MTKADLRRALGATLDQTVRARLAEGDLSDLGEISLNDSERSFLRNAAADEPPIGLEAHRFLRRWTASQGRSSSTGASDSSSKGPFQSRYGKYPLGRFNAAGAMADRDALLAFGKLREALQGRQGDLHNVARRAFVRGEEVDAGELVELLGVGGVEALARHEAFASTGGITTRLKTRFGVLVTGRLMVVVPPQVNDQADLTYFGPDSISLLQRAWSLATGGQLAIDLGTGTGYLAAALAPRYEMVIATELLNSSAWVAALNFRLNQINPGDGRGRLAVCMTDVARGLRPECADFVISNPPFVPAPPHDALDRPLTYADGGPSGLELPARFIREGAKLLAQGGTAVTRCFDITFDDGRRPLADVCSTLQAQGFAAFIEPVRAEDESAAVTEGLRARGLAMTAVISNVIVERSAL